MGARWNAPHDGDVTANLAQDADGIDPIDPQATLPDAAPARRWGRRIGALLPVLLALAWLGYLLLAMAGRVPSPSPDLIVAIGIGTAPLAVALLVYIIVTRGGRGETGRFLRVATAMRTESAALESTLARMAATLVEQNRLLADQAGQLMALGDEAAARLGTVRAGFARDAATFADQGVVLARATDAARVDLGVMMADMPRIDAQVRDLSERLNDAGLNAHEQVGTLDAQLVALAAHVRDADGAATAATQRLAAHLSRIEGVSDVAARRIDAAGTRMAAVAEQALDHAARMLDDLARGLAAEQATLTTIVGESHALIGAAGTDALATARVQLDLLDTRLDDFGQRVAREGSAIHMLAGTLAGDLDHAVDRFQQLGADGGAVTLRLMEGLDAARNQSDATARAVDAGSAAVDRVIDRADRLTGSMERIGAALQGADVVSTRIAARVDTSLPALSGFADRAGQAGDALDRAGDAISRNRAALEALDAALLRTDAETQALADSATPTLLDALQRIRAAADAAADHARAAFAAVGPDAAASLTDAVSAIVETGFAARVETDLAILSSAAKQAADAAAAASDRLGRQLVTIADTTAAVEARIAETRHDAEAADESDFSHRVALLIESLNSNAIDMTRIFSSDVADDAWAAYLRGDRGVFTRRAVRLIDNSEARAIAGHYSSDHAFHDQVNRYVHDFEAMLRRVLASRDGTLLGVTLLSSDMGKLYVVLAQAIERLRA